jgi:hypothetical protein
MKFTSWRKCSKLRTAGHSAQPISPPRIEDTIRPWRTVPGLSSGKVTVSAAGLTPLESNYPNNSGLRPAFLRFAILLYQALQRHPSSGSADAVAQLGTGQLHVVIEPAFRFDPAFLQLAVISPHRLDRPNFSICDPPQHVNEGQRIF